MRLSYLSYLFKKIKEGDILIVPRIVYRYLALYLSRKLGKSLTGPLHGTIIANYNCNLRCGMCDLWKRPSSYSKDGKIGLTTLEMKKLIDDYKAIGTTGIGFTGREPLLRKDMLDLISYCNKKGILTHLSTNGFVIDKIMAEKIIKSRLDSISFSLDGVDAKIHDKSRGVKGSYDKVIQALKNMIKLKKQLKSNIVIIVVCLISKNNLDQVLDLIDLLKKIGIDNISFIPFHDIGLLAKGKETMSSFKIKEDEINKLDKLIDELIKIRKKQKIIENSSNYLELFKSCFRGLPFPIKCYAGYVTIAVDGYGDIYPCFPRAEIGKA